MKRTVFSALMILALANNAQARGGDTAEASLKNIYCMGDQIEIDMKNSTVSSRDLGVKDVKVTFTETQDKDGQKILLGKAKDLHLVAIPHELSGWSGDWNTILTIKNNVATTECNIE
jgi:hypothetical protein